MAGGAGCLCGGAGQIVDRVFPGRPHSELSASTPTSGRLQPGTRGNGAERQKKARGGTFHGEMDRCRESQGWTTAYSGMPERDAGKDQGEDIPKQVGSGWFARPC